MVYRKRYCMYSIIASIGSLLLIFLSMIFEDQLSAEWVAVVSLIIYASILVFWGLTSRRIDFFLVFMSCTYVFYFGYYFLTLFDSKRYTQLLTQFYSLKQINSVAIFILLCVCIMSISFNFFMLTRKRKTNIITEKLCKYRTQESAIKFVAWVMFLVSFVFTCVVLMINIRNTQMYGYAYALTTYYSGYRVERFFSNFLPGSFILLVLAYKNTKVLRLILSLLCVYLVMYFASGSRLQAILLIISLVLVYELEFKHITKAKLIKWSIVFLTICFMLMAISTVRNSLRTGWSWENIWNSIKESFSKENFLVQLIEQCGFQINAIAVVMENCPSPVEYNYGLTYLKGIGQIIPNLFWGQNPFMQESTDTLFAYYLNRGTYGIGSSFIAEAYYNFGYFAVVFMVFCGWLFAKYQMNIDEMYNRKNNFLLRYLYMSIPTYALFYVRSDAVGLLKALVYRSLFPCVAIIAICSIFGRKGRTYDR